MHELFVIARLFYVCETNFHRLGIMLGFPITQSYTVSESETFLTVCVEMDSATSCDITHPFEVILSTADQSAGIYFT